LVILGALCVSVYASENSIQSNKLPTIQNSSVRRFIQSIRGRSSAVVDCPDGTQCDNNHKCCPLHDDRNKYGCCAETNGACCSENAGRDTCCPQSSTCCQGQGCCNSNSHCCSDGGCCLTAQLCCGDFCCNAGAKCCQSERCCSGECCSDGGCCPLQSTCCRDFCCPGGYVCCQNANGCCTTAHPVCCDNNTCCAAGTRCCTGGCCQLDLLQDIVLPEWTYMTMSKGNQK